MAYKDDERKRTTSISSPVVLGGLALGGTAALTAPLLANKLQALFSGEPDRTTDLPPVGIEGFRPDRAAFGLAYPGMPVGLATYGVAGHGPPGLANFAGNKLRKWRYHIVPFTDKLTSPAYFQKYLSGLGDAHAAEKANLGQWVDLGKDDYRRLNREALLGAARRAGRERPFSIKAMTQNIEKNYVHRLSGAGPKDYYYLNIDGGHGDLSGIKPELEKIYNANASIGGKQNNVAAVYEHAASGKLRGYLKSELGLTDKQLKKLLEWYKPTKEKQIWKYLHDLNKNVTRGNIAMQIPFKPEWVKNFPDAALTSGEIAEVVNKSRDLTNFLSDHNNSALADSTGKFLDRDIKLNQTATKALENTVEHIKSSPGRMSTAARTLRDAGKWRFKPWHRVGGTAGTVAALLAGILSGFATSGTK